VSSTAEFGINPDNIEAMAFAWLARQTIKHLHSNLTEVTGAQSPVILGGIYLS
jgi:anhydro-N-acetylmuramic acid kinase